MESVTPVTSGINTEKASPTITQDQGIKPEVLLQENTELNSSDNETVIVSVVETQESTVGSPIHVESDGDIQPGEPSEKTALDDCDINTTVAATGCENPRETNCSICLGEFDNKSFLDQCFHAFCFYCILQWSEVVRTCPLCKASFSQIVHSVRSMLEYELHQLPPQKPKTSANGNSSRFRYRTTITDGQPVRPQRQGASTSNAWEQRAERRDRQLSQRKQRDVMAKEKRRVIYARNLWVMSVSQQGRTKFRDTSPEFFRSNPACTHRLVPWLTRELRCLLNDEQNHVDFLLHLILVLIAKIGINSDQFIEHLESFLADRTHHFAHEFLSFARSPFDLWTYDERARYDWPRGNVEQEDRTPMVSNTSTSGWDSPDTAGPSGLSTLTSLAGPSGLSELASSSHWDEGANQHEHGSFQPIAQHQIGPIRVEDSDESTDPGVENQTRSQESDGSDVIILSPEVRNQPENKHKHLLCEAGSSFVTICGSRGVKNPAVDVIVISSEGTGSPEITVTADRCSSRELRSRNARLRTHKHDHRSKASRPRESRSRNTRERISKSHDECIDSRSTRQSRKRTPRSRSEFAESRSRTRSRKRTSNSRNESVESRSRTRSRKRASNSRNESVESRSRTRSRKRASNSRSESVKSRSSRGRSLSSNNTHLSPSRDLLSRDFRSRLREEETSPTEEEMRQEISELEKKIAEDTKRLTQLLINQEKRRLNATANTEDSGTDEHSR